MAVGTVHVYLLAPDGTPIGSSPPDVAQEGVLFKLLQKAVNDLHTAPGVPVAKPHPQSKPPIVPPGSLAFHLVARGSNEGSWRQFPAETWIVLDRSECNGLFPPGSVSLHTSWDMPPAIAGKFLSWFYPQTEDPQLANRSIIERESFRMTVVTLENGMARARIDATLRMEHSFYPGRGSGDGVPPDLVDARLLGFMDFNPAERSIQRLRLVTEKATYKDEYFDAALRSVSRETLDAQR